MSESILIQKREIRKSKGNREKQLQSKLSWFWRPSHCFSTADCKTEAVKICVLWQGRAACHPQCGKEEGWRDKEWKRPWAILPVIDGTIIIFYRLKTKSHSTSSKRPVQCKLSFSWSLAQLSQVKSKSISSTELTGEEEHWLVVLIRFHEHSWFFWTSSFLQDCTAEEAWESKSFSRYMGRSNSDLFK